MENHSANPEIRYDDGPEVIPEAFSTKQPVPLEDPYNSQDPQVVECAEEKEVYISGYAQGGQRHELVNPETSLPLLKRFRKQICVAVAILGSIVIIAVMVAVLEVKEHRSVANTSAASSTSSASSTNISVTSSNSSTSSINISSASPNPSISSTNVSTTSSSSSTSSTNVSISTSDTYNGTGLSVIYSLLFPLHVVLFYQHSAGSIRASRLVNDVWAPYDQTQDLLVPSGARNGTPIGSVSYYVGSCCDAELWQVFYVDSSNILRDTIRRNTSDTWEDGILADSKIQIPDTMSTGLFAIYGTWFSNTPPVGISTGGIKVFYGAADNLVHVHAWEADDNLWTEGFIFPDSNGNAGIWATSVGSLTYVYLLNSVGTVQMWWKDFNTTVNSTQHPVGVWNKGPGVGGDIRSNSSVAVNGPQGIGFFQLTNDTFTLMGLNQNSESSTMAASQAQSGFVTGIPDSRVAVYTPNSNNTATTYVLYQTNGSDITQFALTPP